VRLKKAIYGCVRSALLWYNTFYGKLQEFGFSLNPYDACVANKVINGKQCTIAWYVDDTKISHADPDVVTSVIEQLEASFGKMTVTRGPEHVFLGMNIRYTGQGTAVISMKGYLEEAIAESGMDIKREATTPARHDLFTVDHMPTALKQLEAAAFHSVTAKLLYVSTRARIDLLLAIAFLSTRVTKSTKQDRLKLKRVLEYIKGTMDMEYTIRADDIGRMRTWVDASFAVHDDMQSHTGGVVSFGTGGLGAKSKKQNIDTKSSTEAEQVGASDYLPNPIWMKAFLESQGYPIHKNYFEQDNESAIKAAGEKRAHVRRAQIATHQHPPVTSGSRTASGPKVLPFATARRRSCWRISLPSPFMVDCSASFGMPFLAWFTLLPSPAIREPRPVVTTELFKNKYRTRHLTHVFYIN
jgi:Reverse transcriptase (RNA-dependent DNA polymerase)